MPCQLSYTVSKAVAMQKWISLLPCPRGFINADKLIKWEGE